jgi:hypothetical protein
MPEFPLSGYSEAISKVLSSVIPPKAYAYFIAFLPGLFFEISIFLANPILVGQLIATSNQVPGLGRYSGILVAVFLAFVIGNALVLWVATIHRTLAKFYGLARFLWRRFCVWPLLPFLNRLMVAQGWLSRRPWMAMNVLRPVQDTVLGMDRRSEGVRRLWGTLAHRLFGERYGVDLSSLSQDEWDALYEAASGTRPIQLSDHLLMVASQAIGWSGLLSTRFAPALLSKNYLAFCFFMVATGILYQWWLIRSMNNSIFFGLLRVRALLRELRKAQPKSVELSADSLHKA